VSNVMLAFWAKSPGQQGGRKPSGNYHLHVASRSRLLYLQTKCW